MSKLPIDGVKESAEKVNPVPVILSESLMIAESFKTVPEGCTVAEAVAVVVPGIGIPVTVSVYVPVAISFRFIVPAGTLKVWVITSWVVLAGTSIGPLEKLSSAVLPE